jgi:hypothetical protein
MARTAIRVTYLEADLWVLFHPRKASERVAAGRSLLLTLAGRASARLFMSAGR